MSKFTPGPWLAATSKETSIGGIEVGPCIVVTTGFDDESRDICCVTSCYKIEDGDIANSRLISAAPDMYEALKSAIDCGIVPVSSASEGGAAKYARQVIVADMIRAALAKADGKA